MLTLEAGYLLLVVNRQYPSLPNKLVVGFRGKDVGRGGRNCKVGFAFWNSPPVRLNARTIVAQVDSV